MIHYRSLIGASLLSLCASVPAFAQQGAAGGTLYKDPAAKSYLPPRAENNPPSQAQPAPQRADRGRTAAMNDTNGRSMGTTNGDGASAAGNPSLTGPKFGGS
jgi:hypothetical protein